MRRQTIGQRRGDGRVVVGVVAHAAQRAGADLLERQPAARLDLVVLEQLGLVVGVHRAVAGLTGDGRQVLAAHHHHHVGVGRPTQGEVFVVEALGGVAAGALGLGLGAVELAADRPGHLARAPLGHQILLGLSIVAARADPDLEAPGLLGHRRVDPRRAVTGQAVDVADLLELLVQRGVVALFEVLGKVGEADLEPDGVVVVAAVLRVGRRVVPQGVTGGAALRGLRPGGRELTVDQPLPGAGVAGLLPAGLQRRVAGLAAAVARGPVPVSHHQREGLSRGEHVLDPQRLLNAVVAARGDVDRGGAGGLAAQGPRPALRPEVDLPLPGALLLPDEVVARVGRHAVDRAGHAGGRDVDVVFGRDAGLAARRDGEDVLARLVGREAQDLRQLGQGSQLHQLGGDEPELLRAPPLGVGGGQLRSLELGPAVGGARKRRAEGGRVGGEDQGGGEADVVFVPPAEDAGLQPQGQPRGLTGADHDLLRRGRPKPRLADADAVAALGQVGQLEAASGVGAASEASGLQGHCGAGYRVTRGVVLAHGSGALGAARAGIDRPAQAQLQAGLGARLQTAGQHEQQRSQRQHERVV